jgi:predicted RNA-binding Zn-ribbon protein involved in translation (DUF1610 family)
MPGQRPPCPECGMAMIMIQKSIDASGNEHGSFECLRCGHIEKPQTPTDRNTNPKRRA